MNLHQFYIKMNNFADRLRAAVHALACLFCSYFSGREYQQTRHHAGTLPFSPKNMVADRRAQSPSLHFLFAFVGDGVLVLSWTPTALLDELLSKPCNCSVAMPTYRRKLSKIKRKHRITERLLLTFVHDTSTEKKWFNVAKFDPTLLVRTSVRTEHKG